MQFPNAKVKLIIRYAAAKLEDMQYDLMYRAYISDALKIISENTAKIPGVNGSYIKSRYADKLDFRKKQPKKSADEIIAEVTKNAGLEVTGE